MELYEINNKYILFILHEVSEDIHPDYCMFWVMNYFYFIASST